MFGAELRRRRQEARMSLADLSGVTHYSKGYLSKLETGAKPPTSETAVICDNALDAGGALRALAPSRTPSGDPEPKVPSHSQEVWILRMEADGSTEFSGMDRRTVLSAGAASLVTAAAGPSPVSPASPETLVWFREQFAALRALGQRAAPRVVLPLAVAQANALRQLAAGTNGRSAEEALGLAARFAEYAGWMAQEAGDDSAALWWTDTAATMAATAGDREMCAYVHVRRALVAMYAHDGARTIGLAERVRSEPGASARVLGLAAKREAQGHALVGDLVSSERALERARELLPVPKGTPSPHVLGSSHVADPVGVARGWCLVDLGRFEEGARVLDEEVARLPGSAVRARTRFGVRRALAHALAGEVDHACALTGELLDGVAASGSATVTADLRRLSQALTRYHGHGAVRDLGPRLVAALHRP
ncbi:helix-turn-helix domain-containing protein [Nocardiopsis alba]|jgi:transcriptional regulator with XRE-family HTH domain|uniref:helix-turn-helix domain-containing protein n=1 Tax=Nocardiopsis alba TaxID=53437 RepID=UPI0003819B52|nr:helix-turn-helix transcriptional regulator [Nocardiopsis alba]